MPHTQLRRTRGFELELRRRAALRRPCTRRDPADGTVRGSGFAVATERLGGHDAALRLGGELDLAAHSALEVALARLERWEPVSVLVDAADVTFVDVTVVRRLVVAHERARAGGGGLLVIHPPGCLLRVLELLDDAELPVLS